MPSKKPASSQDRRSSADREYERQLAERRTQRRILIGAICGILVLVIAGVGGVKLWHRCRTPSVPDAAQPSASAAKPANGKPIRFGRSSAPVTMSLYEDFRCPHCQDFESSVGGKMSELMRDGKLAVKIYPLTFVDPKGASTSTANAFACATKAGFGPAYRTGLFDDHKLDWTDDQLIKLGRGIDADQAKSAGFAGCVRHTRERGWLDSIAKTAHRNKVTETPTVFIDGHRKSDPAEWSASKLQHEVRAAT